MISVLSNNKSEIGDEDHMYLIPHMYPAGAVYEQMETASQKASAGDQKIRKRRRKKSKARSSVDGSETALRKRKLSEEQVMLLELNFGNEHKLECERKDRLAAELNLDPRQVAVWFQNRRARWKTKKLEEEYSRLKAAHDTLVLRNCQLESQVIKLEERIAAEENEVRRLSEGGSSNSPMSCLSMEAAPLFLEGFEEEGLLIPNVFYNMPESAGNYVDWANLYSM